jgi:hypothetical protein
MKIGELCHSNRLLDLGMLTIMLLDFDPIGLNPPGVEQQAQAE